MNEEYIINDMPTNIKLRKPETFNMKIGEIGELNGEYYRLDGINNLRKTIYFTKIKVRKLKGSITEKIVELEE